jgi:hypothetical protein
VSVLATLAASPAAAQIAGFAGFADLGYSNTSFDEDYGGGDSWSNFTVGAGVAFPVDEVANIAWQLDGNYTAQTGDGSSAIVWNFGGSLWWGGEQARVGINVNYETQTDWGSLTNGGVFAEWYFGNITAAAKGGWLWGGGTPTGGRGNYLGAQVGGYFMPNFWIGASGTWSDLVSGATLYGGGIGTPPCAGATCGRRDLTETNVTLDGEFLVSQGLPISVFGGYTFTKWQVSENVSNPLIAAGGDFNTNTFFIGVRVYMGGMGPLINLHRNGNLRGWLRGAN